MAKITIFGLAGTGKSLTGKMLSEEIGYTYLSTGNIFRQMAADHGMSLNDFEALSNTTDVYDRELDEKTKLYGLDHDNFIFESRLAWYFIPDSFKIKLDCDFDTRTSRIASREAKDIKQVQEETSHREDLIRERYKKYYNIEDFTNDSNFDCIVDTKNNNPENVVRIIMEELQERKII